MATEISYLPQLVYENVIKFLEFPQYRNLKVAEKDRLNPTEFVEKVIRQQYIVINANDSNGHSVSVIVFNSGYNAFTHDGKKISNLIKTVGKSDEIILVIQDEISTSIRNAIDEVSDKKDVKIYQYQLFTAELPIVLGVPQHRILRGSEREAILSDIKVRPSELPSVLDTDPQIVWIGGKAGDIVQILRTDGRGISEFYRYVIRGVQIKK
ncbi:MAG TPA: DNA-directed RNA polymerase subunit RpoH/Rpb5 C-terminal domain-containing protein [Candidatus Paceibacterota bacterium]